MCQIVEALSLEDSERFVPWKEEKETKITFITLVSSYDYFVDWLM